MLHFHFSKIGSRTYSHRLMTWPIPLENGPVETLHRELSRKGKMRCTEDPKMLQCAHISAHVFSCLYCLYRILYNSVLDDSHSR